MRRCKNWLDTYRQYILPRTDAPESFIRWSGVFAIAAALRRQVWVPGKYLGVWKCYTPIYLMFVGPPGVRKTTSIDSGSLPLLSQVPAVHIGADAFTKEAVIEAMQQSEDNSICIVLGEFSDAMQKAGKSHGQIYEFLTSMFDGKTEYNTSTKTAGNNRLIKPALNMFSATTPGWIADNMPESVLSGGFASRVIFIYEDSPRINKMFFDDVLDEYDERYGEGYFQQLEDNLLIDLIEMSKMNGEFTFDKEAKEYAAEWSMQPPPIHLTENPKLAGYLNRKKTHVLKLAMIHSAATKDELIITKEDWIAAVDMIESTEFGLEKVFQSVGNNKDSMSIDRIISWVKRQNTLTQSAVTHSMLLRAFRDAGDQTALTNMIRYLMESRSLIHLEAYGEDGYPDYLFWHPSFKHAGEGKVIAEENIPMIGSGR